MIIDIKVIFQLRAQILEFKVFLRMLLLQLHDFKKSVFKITSPNFEGLSPESTNVLTYEMFTLRLAVCLT
jgi:hypothetical protein